MNNPNPWDVEICTVDLPSFTPSSDSVLLPQYKSWYIEIHNQWNQGVPVLSGLWLTCP